MHGRGGLAAAAAHRASRQGYRQPKLLGGFLGFGRTADAQTDLKRSFGSLLPLTPLSVSTLPRDAVAQVSTVILYLSSGLIFMVLSSLVPVARLHNAAGQQATVICWLTVYTCILYYFRCDGSLTTRPARVCRTRYRSFGSPTSLESPGSSPTDRGGANGGV